MRAHQTELSVLDCTLRDGGFYTGWEFPEPLVHAYIHAMDRAGIAYAELGYRALHRKRFAGALGYTPDWYVERLPQTERLRFAVMLEAKEWVERTARLEELFALRSRSRVALVRIATAYGSLATAIELSARLLELGYASTINLMAAARLSDVTLGQVFRKLDASSADVVYFADSFGSMYPEDIARCAAILKESTGKPWGVHLHNNLELAFSNALEAIRVGASWVDVSVTGMGRGPGNLRTELFMQHLCSRAGRDNDTGPIHDFISRHMLPLQAQHAWGPGPAYILSGFLGAHPSYAQQLLASGRYSIGEVKRILESVHATGSAASYDEGVLAQAISDRHRADDSLRAITRLPRLGAQTVPWKKRKLLIVGRGPSANAHAFAINEYIARFDPIVIECNHLREIERATHHFCAFVVAANARAMAAEAVAAGKNVIVASRTLAQGIASQGVFSEEYDVRPGQLDFATPDGSMVLPADVVSMLAISLSVRCGVEQIELVGFDGYGASVDERELRMQSEMEEFIRLLRERAPSVALTSLTRTTFTVDESSIYERLRDA